ncbi:MAG: hypothetical protein A3E85_04285 [Gammaproteobacteria bacterium RIFCSPHIGHO2_12_FULL_45_12]|nr:MAG: hypothetical protein A3E85_04285 [Gammaproteobacteria bacterium RIFCSPHIGHO2_12_FULL_45_12]
MKPLSSSLFLNVLTFFLVMAMSGSSVQAVTTDSADIHKKLPFTKQQAKPHMLQQNILSAPTSLEGPPQACPAPAYLSCPNANGVYSTGFKTPPANSSCPSICHVTRVDQVDSGTNPVTVLNTVIPICPSGYVQSGSFGLVPAIVHQDQGEPAPYPIPTIEAFNAYNDSPQYQCKLAPTYPQPISACRKSDRGGFVTNDPIVLKNINDKKNILISFYILFFPTITGVGQYTSYYNLKDEGIIYIIDTNCTKTTPYGSRGTWHEEKFLNYFSFQQCTPLPAGLYYSKTQQVQSSIVCTRMKSGWILSK